MEELEIEQIINSVQANWSKDYIIRYLYVKLAPYFRKDLKYFLATEEEKLEEFKSGFVNRGKNIVCSTLADYYVNLYQTFGIEAKKIVANSAKIPLFAVIVRGNYGWFFIDPLNDLFNNQYGLKTTEFGMIPHYKTLTRNYPELVSLSKEYIEEIDKSLGLPATLDDYFDKLHLEMTNSNFCREHFNWHNSAREDLFIRKMEFSRDELLNIGKVSGPLERIKLYLFLERTLFFKYEKRNLKIWLNQDYEVPRTQIEYTNFSNGNSVLYQEVHDDKKFTLKRLR